MDMAAGAGGAAKAGGKVVGRHAGPLLTRGMAATSAGLRSSEERGGNTRWRATAQNWQETKAAQQQGAQDIGATNAKFGRQTSWSDRREAGRAAGAERARELMRGNGNPSSPSGGGGGARQRPIARKSWEKTDAHMGPWGPGAKKK